MIPWEAVAENMKQEPNCIIESVDVRRDADLIDTTRMGAGKSYVAGAGLMDTTVTLRMCGDPAEALSSGVSRVLPMGATLPGPVPKSPPPPANETTTRGEWPSRFLVTPKTLSKAQRARLRDQWEARYTGPADTSRVLRCGAWLGPDWLDVTLKAAAYMGLVYGIAVALKAWN